jgi:hypothetical protein
MHCGRDCFFLDVTLSTRNRRKRKCVIAYLNRLLLLLISYQSVQKTQYFTENDTKNKADSPFHVPAITSVKSNVLLVMIVRYNHCEAGL